MEETLMLIKPDAVQKNAVGNITAMVEDAGFEVRGMRMVRLTKAQAQAFYAEHESRGFFGELVEFMTSGRIVALCLVKENAIKDLRQLVGKTDSREADAGTIRATYGTDNQKNAVHASDSPESAVREIAFYFSRLDTHHAAQE